MAHAGYGSTKSWSSLTGVLLGKYEKKGFAAKMYSSSTDRNAVWYSSGSGQRRM